MTDKENRDSPRPDDLSRAPTDPGDPKPAPLREPTPMIGVEDAYKTEDPQATPTGTDVQIDENDGFTMVITNGEKRRIKIFIADKNTIIDPTPVVPPTRNSDVPAPPPWRSTKTTRRQYYKKKKESRSCIVR